MSQTVFLLLFANFLSHLGNGLEEIGNEANVSHLKDWSLGVLIDGHDSLRVLHAGQMLNGSRDAHRYVKLGRQDLTRLSNL